jgi:quercetin dioxygenase-like cupin family protein
MNINPGQPNPRHLPPNCDGIPDVVGGRIRHMMNDVAVEMNAGDAVSIPQGVLHHAADIWTSEAALAISSSSACRKAVGYLTQ